MTIAHIHAALMAEYAKDAAETNTPWDRWEFSYPSLGRWLELLEHPEWDPRKLYRRKRTPLCQVEGRDVFPGDKLWSNVCNCWLIAKRTQRCSTNGLVLVGEDLAWFTIHNLSWTEPPRTKTVYQWAMRQGDRWFSSSVMVADKVEMIANFPNFTDFRRLDYTALEVPA